MPPTCCIDALIRVQLQDLIIYTRHRSVAVIGSLVAQKRIWSNYIWLDRLSARCDDVAWSAQKQKTAVTVRVLQRIKRSVILRPHVSLRSLRARRTIGRRSRCAYSRAYIIMRRRANNIITVIYFPQCVLLAVQHNIIICIHKTS
jgi:hypothetical protein